MLVTSSRAVKGSKGVNIYLLHPNVSVVNLSNVTSDHVIDRGEWENPIKKKGTNVPIPVIKCHQPWPSSSTAHGRPIDRRTRINWPQNALSRFQMRNPPRKIVKPTKKLAVRNRPKT